MGGQAYPQSSPYRTRNDPIKLKQSSPKISIIAALIVLLSACEAGKTMSDNGTEAKDSWKFTERLPDNYRRNSFNIVDGRIYEISQEGLSKTPVSPDQFQARLGEGRRVIMIHGTMYDPDAPGLANPHLTIFQAIRAQVGDRAVLSGIGWPSAPFTARNLGLAWGKGRLSWYGLAIENADETVQTLSGRMPDGSAQYSFICHSIGCDIVRQLVREAGARPEHVLMLAPDTDYADMSRWAQETGTPVLQVNASRDGVLGFGRYAGRNRNFAPPQNNGPYRSVLVDVDHYLPGLARYSADYVNPRRYLDHMAPIEIPELWPNYLQFLGY